jgi:hypothetical protein
MNIESPLHDTSTNQCKQAVKAVQPKPEVILHGRHGTGHPNDFHLRGWKTTLTETGAVDITIELIAKAWHFNSFCEHYDEDGSSRTGTWVMFTEDVTFRAGEGLWLVPHQCMKAPRVEVLRSGI